MANSSMIAIYPGTFDPVTYGHLDIMKRAASMFDHLIVAIAVDTKKNAIFDTDTRVELAQKDLTKFGLNNVIVKPFYGLLVDFAKREGAKVIVRGLRAVSDFEYEFQMAFMNYKLNPNVETIFLPATENSNFISSSFVKEIARLGGNLKGFVSEAVAEALYNYYAKE